MIEHNTGIRLRQPIHLWSRDPDAVNDIELRSEHAIAFHIGNQRALVVGEQFARDQDLAARLVDMRIDRKIVLMGKIRATAQHCRRTALRRERRDRPMECSGRGVAFELVLQVIELVLDWPAHRTEHLLDVRRQRVVVPHHGNGRDIPNHGRKHHA